MLGDRDDVEVREDARRVSYYAGMDALLEEAIASTFLNSAIVHVHETEGQ